jgi:phenylpropionate dioxygenase-like ring-hydroxylating dioxygenase large terminal subunit
MFLGHITDIKNNNWRVYPQLKNWALTNAEHRLSLVSNVCKHQGSRLQGKAGEGNRTCPYHGWRYSVAGEPISSGTTKCPNSVALDTREVAIENNFVFSDPVKLPELNFINTQNLNLVENRVDTVRSNWRHIIDLFLDVDHIPMVHPGVYQEISAPNVSDIQWHYKHNASIQLVPRIEVKNAFNDTLLKEDLASPYSAAWTTVFPYTMMEWQPGAWFVTVCVPVNDNLTEVNVYKYRDNRYSAENWEINSRVWETAWAQDRAQAEQLTSVEIPLTNLEEQKLHFRRWLDEVAV